MMPEVRTTVRSGDTVTVRLFVPAALELFRGHFPGCPILPGVVQIDWAVRLGRAHFTGLGESYGLENFKCRAPVRPETELTLTLAGEPGRLRFAYVEGERPVASGTVLFR